jgi:hypothetical protein
VARIRLARRWSRAVHDHPTVPDGPLYRADHDNCEICAALFGQCTEKLVLREAVGPFAVRLAALLDRYNVGRGWALGAGGRAIDSSQLECCVPYKVA